MATVCFNCFLLLYDCRNFKGQYVGRMLYHLDTNEDYEDFKLHRSLLDSDPLLKRACTWKYKRIDTSLVNDYVEFEA